MFALKEYTISRTLNFSSFFYSTGSVFRKDLTFRRYIFIKRTKPSFMQPNHTEFEFIQSFVLNVRKRSPPGFSFFSETNKEMELLVL